MYVSPELITGSGLFVGVVVYAVFPGVYDCQADVEEYGVTIVVGGGPG